MTRGLRCPNCDSTVHRKEVVDFLLNKKTPHLRCKNAFCNRRWSRAALESHKAQFLGESAPAKAASKPAAPTVMKTEVKRPKQAFSAKRPAMRKDETWLDRIRFVARQYALNNGVVSIDDLREWADANYMQPMHSSAWGAVFQGDEWERASEKRSTYRKSRSRKITVWKHKALVTSKVAI